MKYLKKYKLFEEEEEPNEYELLSTSGDLWLTVDEDEFFELVNLGYVEDMDFYNGRFKDKDYQKIEDFLDMKDDVEKYNL